MLRLQLLAHSSSSSSSQQPSPPPASPSHTQLPHNLPPDTINSNNNNIYTHTHNSNNNSNNTTETCSSSTDLNSSVKYFEAPQQAIPSTSSSLSPSSSSNEEADRPTIEVAFRLNDILKELDEETKRHGCKEMIGDKLYTFERPIGQGSDGEVFLAIEDASNRQVAVKIIGKEGKRAEQIRRARREAEIHNSLRHPNVLALHDFAETEDELCLVTEYASNGDLFDLLYGTEKECHKDFTGLVEPRLAKKVFAQTLLAVEHCHRNHVAHRDIKPENILLDHNMNVKLADFGLAFRYRDNGVVSTPVGSLVYAAPEVLSATGYEGPEVDTWALGVLLFELVAGTYPFIVNDEESDTNSIETQTQMCHRILSCDYVIPSYVDADARMLISKILQKHKHRISIAEIKQHPWIRDTIAEMEEPAVVAPVDNWTPCKNAKQNENPSDKENHNNKVTTTTTSTTPKKETLKRTAQLSPSFDSLMSTNAGESKTSSLPAGWKQKHILKKPRRVANSGNLSKNVLAVSHLNQDNQLKRSNLLSHSSSSSPTFKHSDSSPLSRSAVQPVINSTTGAWNASPRNCRTEASVTESTTANKFGMSSWPKWCLPDRPRTLSANCN